MDDLISVIIPVYNAGMFIEKCIQSILNQTHKNLELILVNDGSTDNSLDICLKYQKIDKRVKVLCQRNTGVSSARNLGIQSSVGDWISFVDADDWLDEDIFDWALNKQSDCNVDIVMWNQSIEFEKSTRALSLPEEDILTDTAEKLEEFKFAVFSGRTCSGKRIEGTRNIYARIIRNNLIRDNNIFFNINLKHHEDMIFMLETFEQTKRIYVSNRIGYHRKMHDNSAIKRYYPSIVKDNKLASVEYHNFLRQYNKNSLYYTFYYGFHIYWFLQILDLYILHDENSEGMHAKKRRIIQLLNEEPYVTAFRSNKLSLPFSRRIFIFLARRECAIGIIAYREIEKMLKKKQNR